MPSETLHFESERLAQPLFKNNPRNLEAHRALHGAVGIAQIEFQRRDVVRHPLVQRIMAAYEDHRRKT